MSIPYPTSLLIRLREVPGHPDDGAQAPACALGIAGVAVTERIGAQDQCHRSHMHEMRHQHIIPQAVVRPKIALLEHRCGNQIFDQLTVGIEVLLKLKRKARQIFKILAGFDERGIECGVDAPIFVSRVGDSIRVVS